MIGFGTKVRYSLDGLTWIYLAGLTKIMPPKKTKKITAVTKIGSISEYEEYQEQIKKSGLTGLILNYSKDVYLTLEKLYALGGTIYFEIIFPDTDLTTFEFSGILKDLAADTPLAKQIGIVCQIQVTERIKTIVGVAPVLSGAIVTGGTLPIASYEYQIAAFDGVVWSKVSNQVTEVLIATGSIALSWTYSGSVTKYRIWRTSGGVFDGFYDLITTTLLTLTDDGSLVFETTDSEIF